LPLPLRAAEAAGVVLGQIRSERERVRLAIDTMVMAFAAIYGGAIVYTSGIDDLARLHQYFPSVRVLAV
jgi:hypothetical protein